MYNIFIYNYVYDFIIIIIIHAFILDCEIAQHQLSVKEMAADLIHQKLNDELQLNRQKIKHLESNITKLYQTAEIWKKGNR